MGNQPSSLVSLHEHLVKYFNLDPKRELVQIKQTVQDIFECGVNYEEFMWIVSLDLVREVWIHHPKHSAILLVQAVHVLEAVFSGQTFIGNVPVFNAIRFLSRFAPCLLELASMQIVRLEKSWWDDPMRFPVEHIEYASKLAFNILFTGNDINLPSLFQIQLVWNFCILLQISYLQKCSMLHARARCPSRLSLHLICGNNYVQQRMRDLKLFAAYFLFHHYLFIFLRMLALILQHLAGQIFHLSRIFLFL